MYNIKYTTSFNQYFKKLKDNNLKNEIIEAVDLILKNPYIGKPKKGDLHNIFCYDIYYNKTNYEIAYMIKEQEGKLVVVILAGTRENFYKDLKRLIK